MFVPKASPPSGSRLPSGVGSHARNWTCACRPGILGPPVSPLPRELITTVEHYGCGSPTSWKLSQNTLGTTLDLHWTMNTGHPSNSFNVFPPALMSVVASFHSPPSSWSLDRAANLLCCHLSWSRFSVPVSSTPDSGYSSPPAPRYSSPSSPLVPSSSPVPFHLSSDAVSFADAASSTDEAVASPPFDASTPVHRPPVPAIGAHVIPPPPAFADSFVSTLATSPPPTTSAATRGATPHPPPPAEATTTVDLVLPPVVPEVPPSSDGVESSHVTNKFPEDGSFPTGGQVSASTFGSPSAFGVATSEPPASPTSTIDAQVPAPTAPLLAETTTTVDLVLLTACSEVPPSSDGMESSHVANKFPEDGSCPTGGQVSASTVGSPFASGDATSEPPVSPTSTIDTQVPASTAPLLAETTTTVDLVLLTACNEVPPSSDGMESSHVTNKFPEDGSAPTGGQVSALALGSPSASGDVTSEPPASPTSTIDAQVPAPTAPLLAETTTTVDLVLLTACNEVPPSSDGMESSHVANKFPEDGSCPTGGQVSASTVGSPFASGDAISEPPASPTSTIDSQVPASTAPLLAETTTAVDLVLLTACNEVPPSSDGMESSHVANKFPEDGSCPTGGQVSASTVGSPFASGDAASAPPASPTSTIDSQVPASTAPLLAETTTTVDLVLLTACNEVPPSSDGMESSHVANKFPEDGSCPTGGQVSASTVGSPFASGDATSKPPASPTSTIDTQVPASTAPLLAETTTTVDLVLLTACNEVPPSSDGRESSHVTNKFPEDGSAPTGGQVSALALGSPFASGDATSEPPASPTSTIDTQVPASDVPLLADTTSTAVPASPTSAASVPSVFHPLAATSTSGPHVLLPHPGPPTSRPSSKHKKKKKKRQKGRSSICAANSCPAANSYAGYGALSDELDAEEF